MAIINVIKLVVGVDTVTELHNRNRHIVEDYNGQPAIPVKTRRKPRREKDILEGGGSLYRVIKGRIRCRQKILGFKIYEDSEGISRCKIMVDPQIILTIEQPHRPFQGWRYLEPAKSPADKSAFDPDESGEDDLPEEMRDELTELGLL